MAAFFFALPKLLQLLVVSFWWVALAVSQRDYPVITGIFLLVGVGVMTINLLVDISYALLDPKIRQG